MAKFFSWTDSNLQQVHEVNVCGVLFAAQAAGRQMVKLGIPGSIVLSASTSGHITNPVRTFIEPFDGVR